MKKVLFTATVDSHILQFHLPFLKLFKEKGYEVHVATNGDEKIPYCDIKHVISFERNPIKINNLKAIRNLKKIINNEKFDIIHCHTPMGGVVTRIAARKARKKYHTRVIYTAHGFHFYKGAPKLNWLIYYPIEKWLAKYTDTLITINKEDFELANKKFSKRCFDIQYVPGVGIDENKFNFKMSEREKNELRKSLGLTKGDFVMIYPAEISKRKRQMWLINTLSSLMKKEKNIHLLLPGQDSLDGKCQKLVNEMKLENQIHFLGYRNDIPKLLKISNLAVSSANQEGLPVNIMEAMYVGLPIVASNCRGNRDLVKNGKNGYVVEINDMEDFTSKIIKIYNDQKLCVSISKNNLENIKGYYLTEILNYMQNIYYKKKKVLHLLSSNQFSGAENVACTIIDALKDKYDSYYCSPSGPISEKLKEKNINYLPIKKLSIREVKRVVNKVKPDIIHAHDNKATVYSSLFHKKSKIISHIHGNNKIMNSFNIKSWLFNHSTKNISRFIWVSDSSLAGYYFNKKIEDKSIILYNIVCENEILNNSQKYEITEKYDACFLGRLGYPKNIERLIEIIKKIKDKKSSFKIAIVGDGPDREFVLQKIKDYNLKDNIKMYGYQSNPYPILMNSKLLIMTSIYEGTPMSALEAQALSKPIVATPVDGLKKIVKNGVNGYLSNDDEELVNKIIEISSNDNMYNSYSINTRKLFKKSNDVKKYMSKIEDIYDM